MWLVDSQKLELYQYFDSQVPGYGILSHTSGHQEVSLQQLRDTPPKKLAHLSGYQKIKHCCAFAVSKDIKYVWIDTCCIDKTSSAELSEAINSMFRWYQNAKVC